MLEKDFRGMGEWSQELLLCGAHSCLPALLQPFCMLKKGCKRWRQGLFLYGAVPCFLASTQAFCTLKKTCRGEGQEMEARAISLCSRTLPSHTSRSLLSTLVWMCKGRGSPFFLLHTIQEMRRWGFPRIFRSVESPQTKKNENHCFRQQNLLHTLDNMCSKSVKGFLIVWVLCILFPMFLPWLYWNRFGMPSCIFIWQYSKVESCLWPSKSNNLISMP